MLVSNAPASVVHAPRGTLTTVRAPVPLSAVTKCRRVQPLGATAASAITATT